MPEINEGFPAWRYGPDNQESIFTTPEQVPEGWMDHPSAFSPEEAPVNALDHDGDGAPGGSTAPEQTDRLKELRAEYLTVIGKKAFAGWDEAELEKRIAAAQAEAKPEAQPEAEAKSEIVEIDTTEF